MSRTDQLKHKKNIHSIESCSVRSNSGNHLPDNISSPNTNSKEVISNAKETGSLGIEITI